jgi:hypothetical protein
VAVTGWAGPLLRYSVCILDRVGAGSPTIDEMAAWVMGEYPKVTKHAVVQSYLRSVLYTMGLIDFDGERVILTSRGEKFQQNRTKLELLGILRENILGIGEILDALGTGPQDLAALRTQLVDRLKVNWETEHQVRFRMQWLVACGAVRRVGSRYELIPLV